MIKTLLTALAVLLPGGGALSPRDAAAAMPDAFHPGAQMRAVRPALTPPPQPVFDPRAFGARGDGVTYDTAAIQQAIDRCAGTGGSVVLQAGAFLSAQLTLRGKMTFYVAAGATLLGGVRPEDYPEYVPPGALNKDIRHSLLLADHADGLTLDGAGTVDEQGQKMPMTGREPYRPSLLRVFESRDVTVRGLTVRNPRMWTLYFTQCDRLTVEDVTVRAPAGYCPNLDGMDICDSSHVLVRDCDIASQDDGICLKSSGPAGLHHIRIENNTIHDFDANGIKIGTATVGPIDDVLILNNTVWQAAYGGLCIESVDGSPMRGITVRGLDLYDVAEPIFIRLARRGGAVPAQGALEDVTIDRVRVLATRSQRGTGSTISGTARARVRNILIEDCYLELPGGCVSPPAPRAVNDAGYPQSSIFGVTPGYAFFVLHADGVRFQNVTCGFARQDTRPWLAAQDSRVTVQACADRRQITPARPPRDRGNAVSGAGP